MGVFGGTREVHAVDVDLCIDKEPIFCLDLGFPTDGWCPRILSLRSPALLPLALLATLLAAG